MEADLDILFEKTALLDSAVRAVSLQKLLVPAWNEYPNAYVIKTRLSMKD